MPKTDDLRTYKRIIAFLCVIVFLGVIGHLAKICLRLVAIRSVARAGMVKSMGPVLASIGEPDSVDVDYFHGHSIVDPGVPTVAALIELEYRTPFNKLIIELIAVPKQQLEADSSVGLGCFDWEGGRVVYSSFPYDVAIPAESQVFTSSYIEGWDFWTGGTMH